MKTKSSLVVATAVIVAAICMYFVNRTPSSGATIEGLQAARSPGSEGKATTHGSEPAAKTSRPRELNAVSTVPAKSASSQELVLAMYDVIVDELERADGDCDAMGKALSNTVDAHSDDVQRWLREQRQLTPERRAQLERELDTTAAERVKSAQEAMREGLGKCAGNATFIGAFQKLASLTPAG